MESLGELSKYCDENVRLDLKTVAVEHILGITGSVSGTGLLLKCPETLQKLINLLGDNCKPVAKDAAVCLVNVSADEQASTVLINLSESSKTNDNLISLCTKHILDKRSTIADACCMILSNMSRWLPNVDKIIALIEKSGFTWEAIINAFTATKYNEVGAKLHYMGPLFSNLSQSPRMRRFLIDESSCMITRLFPFTEYPDSMVRRGGIVGTLRNCCFDAEHRDFLLSPEIDILSHLLLPLAGPEEFDDEDNNKLPLDLQYLPETKQREQDPDIRQMLLEALTQLCATKKCREMIREKNAYVILRELHVWEKDEAVLFVCENLVNILIRTEDEIGADDLDKLEIPAEYKDKFEKLDKDMKNT